MSELVDDVIAFVARDNVAASLGRELGRDSHDEVRDAAVLVATATVANLASWAEEPTGRAWLRHELPAVDTSALDHFTELRAHRDFHVLGEVLATELFRDRRSDVASLVGQRSRVTPDDADLLLVAVSWLSVGLLAARYQRAGGDEAVIDRLHEERESLVDRGWGQWIEATSGAADPPRAPGEPTALGATDAPAVTGAVGSAASAPPVPIAIEETARPDAPHQRRRWTSLGALAALVVVAAVAVAAVVALAVAGRFGRGSETASDGAPTVSAPAAETTSAIGESAAGPSTETGEGSGTGDHGPSGDGAGDPDAGDDEPVETTGSVTALRLVLTDPEERTDATGSANFELDTGTGELCYAFDLDGFAENFNAHVHVGAAGERGGVIVDFGGLSGSPSACIDRNPTDLQSILDDRAGHYVELHPTDANYSLRTQLGEDADGDRSGATTADDPDAALVVVEDGTVQLRGTVADEETADAFAAAYDDLARSPVEVIDQLSVAPGAAAPSDRIVVTDAVLFAVDSANLSPLDLAIVEDVAAVLRVRTDWRITVVGHTDTTGPFIHNLELSLARASAVREALIAAGVSAAAVTIRGDGPTAAIVGGETLDDRARNRRIEFVIQAPPAG